MSRVHHTGWAGRVGACLCAAALVLSWHSAGGGQSSASAATEVDYTISVPEPARRYVQVSAVFPRSAGAPLDIHMSRSSPGRYALHDFAKNVFAESAADATGRALTLERTALDRWTVPAGEGPVRFSYRVYGDTINGTYLAVDETHAHMNVPATLAWARGLEHLPARVRLVPPAGRTWRVATQLFPTSDPLVFTAPNLAYLADSPIEFGETRLHTFRLPIRDDGPEATMRVALHHTGSDEDAASFVKDVERIVREQRAIYGELPAFETGTYTFIADYLPWARGDGMEHRNSTILTSSAPLAMARVDLLDTVAHEFFHAWNVERIRPRGLEPFNLAEVNVTPDLWLAEGFTSYYGPLTMTRAGLSTFEHLLTTATQSINAVQQAPGRAIRSAATMSRLAGLHDGALAADRTDGANTFLSYYTWGAAIALGLDLEIRGRTNGLRSLDDYMRALWQRFGAPGGRVAGVVDQPYTHDDLITVLSGVMDDPNAARDFFRRFIDGHDVPDYGALLAPAGLKVVRARPGQAWVGALPLESQGSRVRVREIPRAGTPVWEAGFAQDDVILEVDGRSIESQDAWARAIAERKPGTVVPVRVDRRGRTTTLSLTLGEDPDIEVVRTERAGGSLTPAQDSFRRAWMESKVAAYAGW